MGRRTHSKRTRDACGHSRFWRPRPDHRWEPWLRRRQAGNARCRSSDSSLAAGRRRQPTLRFSAGCACRRVHEAQREQGARLGWDSVLGSEHSLSKRKLRLLAQPHLRSWASCGDASQGSGVHLLDGRRREGCSDHRAPVDRISLEVPVRCVEGPVSVKPVGDAGHPAQTRCADSKRTTYDIASRNTPRRRATRVRGSRNRKREDPGRLTMGSDPGA